MDRGKREVILDEIEYWRENRLLPGHYCDFLINLYDVDQERSDKKVLSMNSLQQGNIRTWLFTFIVVCFICLTILYFATFPFLVQLVCIPLFTALCYTGGIRLRTRNALASSFLLAIGSLLMLGLGIFLIREQGMDERIFTTLLILVCAIIWCILGYVISSPVLLYIGFGAFVLLYAGFFAQVQPRASWLMLQGLWLPISLLLMWFCWLVHHRGKKMAAVYFTSSLAVWFMPEIDEVFLRGQMPEAFALFCMVKVALICIILFVLRKKWIAWVAA